MKTDDQNLTNVSIQRKKRTNNKQKKPTYNNQCLLTVSLFGLGLVAGPIQPVNAELAVEVTFPSDETAVESSQQIFGNLISALIIPLAELASKSDITLFPAMAYESDVRGDVLLLAGITAFGEFCNVK